MHASTGSLAGRPPGDSGKWEFPSLSCRTDMPQELNCCSLGKVLDGRHHTAVLHHWIFIVRGASAVAAPYQPNPPSVPTYLLARLRNMLAHIG